MSGDGCRPDPHVHLLCGQAVSVNKIDSSVLVRVTVSSRRAIDDLQAADTAVSSFNRHTTTHFRLTVDISFTSPAAIISAEQGHSQKFVFGV